MLRELNNKLISQPTINNILNNPGCYLFKDKTGAIIYVGKAQNLKKRVSSYFPSSPDNYFHQQIHSFNTIITNNVKEALILEQNLIKKYQPRFNVLLKDNHYYPYLEITGGENPRYKVVRKINLTSPNEYCGPFPDGSKAREILQLLERLFPLAKCKEVRKFFHGQTQEIKQKIKNSLRKNITNLAFEIAHKEKKILDNIDFFTSQQNIEFGKEENCDFFGIYQQEKVMAFYLLIYRYGKLVATDEAAFPIWGNQAEIVETYLYQFYQNNLPPQILYISQKLPGIELLAEELGFACKSPQRGRKKEFQQVNKSQALTEISRFLAITAPNYLECLDISNLYKQDIVAGFLTFINGEKNLLKSKLYKLAKTEQESDIARIKTACRLHYQKYSPEKMPDLIIVDGGKEQVKAVQQVLQELKLKAPVIGLVKDENHRTAKIITNELKELDFGKNERIKNFLTNCQEEVHQNVYRNIPFNEKEYNNLTNLLIFPQSHQEQKSLEKINSILFPDLPDNPSNLETEITRLKITDLIIQIPNKKNELEKAVNNTKNKLNKAEKYLLEKLLQEHLKSLSTENSNSEELTELKEILTEKLNKVEIETILVKQKELRELEKHLKNLQERIEIEEPCEKPFKSNVKGYCEQHGCHVCDYVNLKGKYQNPPRDFKLDFGTKEEVCSSNCKIKAESEHCKEEIKKLEEKKKKLLQEIEDKSQELTREIKSVFAPFYEKIKEAKEKLYYLKTKTVKKEYQYNDYQFIIVCRSSIASSKKYKDIEEQNQKNNIPECKKCQLRREQPTTFPAGYEGPPVNNDNNTPSQDGSPTPSDNSGNGNDTPTTLSDNSPLTQVDDNKNNNQPTKSQKPTSPDNSSNRKSKADTTTNQFQPIIKYSI
ncbi:9522_t:CDS:2 [Entrophospora sp. SA101]|nr:9522_t:CDS:2 [Entrophospora sp. SA101]